LSRYSGPRFGLFIVHTRSLLLLFYTIHSTERWSLSCDSYHTGRCHLHGELILMATRQQTVLFCWWYCY